MKPPIKSKIIFLVLLLFSSQLAKAQGLENAMGLFVIVLFILLALVLFAVIMLIIFIVKRNRTIGIVSAICGFFLLLFGSVISLQDRGSNSVIENVSDWLKTAGAINLTVVFVFSKVFPKKNITEPKDIDPDLDPDIVTKQEPERSGESIVKWLSLVLTLWFFYHINSAFQYLKYTTDLFSYTASSISPINQYFLLMQFLPLLLLLICIFLFISHKRTGWVLLVFYSLYTLIGFVSYIVRTTFVKPGNQAEIPINIQIIQLFTVFFFALTLWLILRPNVRILFSVDKKFMLVTLASCATITLFIVMVSNLLF